MLKNILLGASAFALIAACGEKEKTVTQPAAENVAVEAVKEAVADIKIAPGNAANAEAALAALSLADSGVVQFGNKTVDGANASFENIALGGGGDLPGISAAKLSLEGLDKKGDAASFGRLFIDNLTLDMGEEDAGLSLGSFEVINPSDDLTSFITDFTEDGKIDGEMPNFEDILAFGFDRLQAKDLSISAPSDDFDGTISLASFGIDENTAESIGKIALKGLKIDGNQDGQALSVSLGEVSLGGMVKSKFKRFLALSDLENPDFSKIYGGDDNPADPGYDSLNLDNLDVLADGIGISLPSMSIATSRYDSGAIKFSEIKPMQLSVEAVGDSDAATEFKNGIANLGLDKLEIIAGVVGTMSEDQDTASLEVGQNYVGLKDFATIKLGMDYSGMKDMYAAFQSLDADTLSNDPSAIMQAYAPLAFSKLDIHIENNGGVDTLLNLAAQSRGMDVQSMIDEAKGLAAMAPMMAASQGIDAALVSELINAGLSFMEDPKTLKLGVVPQEPLTIMSFADQETVMGMTKSSLGFTATNE